MNDSDVCTCSHRRDDHTVTSVGAMCLKCADCWGFTDDEEPFRPGWDSTDDIYIARAKAKAKAKVRA